MLLRGANRNAPHRHETCLTYPTMKFSSITRSKFLLAAGLLCASTAFAAEQKKDLGTIYVPGDKAIGVKITASSPDMQKLAVMAFSSHGRYKVVGNAPSYDVRFTSIAPTQVKVDVLRGVGGAPVFSQTVSGTSARNALLRAADVVVEKTSNQNLKGFFASQLAFVITQRGNKGDVYVSDLYLGGATNVTQRNSHTLMPRWSPDGRRVIYTSYFNSGAPDIFTVDPTNGQKNIFANFKGTNMGARFSPNGQQVVMICGSGTSNVYVTGAGGGRSPQQLTRTEGVKASPAWSPDGSRIIFAMEPGPQLYIMPASGGAPQRLSTGFSFASEPDWSVGNPNKIAFTARAGGSYQIAVYDMASKSAKIVSSAGFDGVEPSWLADGRHLVYTARDRNSSVLCILDTETGKSTTISGTNIQAQQANVLAPAR